METIKIACPKCGQHLEASDEVFGQNVDCPTCAASFVPAPPPTLADRRKALRHASAYRDLRLLFDVLLIIGFVTPVVLAINLSAEGWPLTQSVTAAAGSLVGIFWLALLRMFAHTLFDIADSLLQRSGNSLS